MPLSRISGGFAPFFQSFSSATSPAICCPDALFSSTELYDPGTNTFAPPDQTANMNAPRQRAVAVELANGKVLIAGGTIANIIFPFALSGTELYDEATNTFEPPSKTPTMNNAREDSIAVVLSTGPNPGEALIVCGFGCPIASAPCINDQTFRALASTELYDPTTNSFAPPNATATLNIARGGCTATLLNDGKVLVDGYAQQVELYDPSTNTFTLGPNSNFPTGGGTATLLR